MRDKINIRKVAIGIVLCFCHSLIFSQILLPKVFGDSMVLQRGIQIPVWGSALPGAKIIAELGKVSTTTTTDQHGKWRVCFPPFKAGGPYSLTISEQGKPKTSIVLKGILIGDVWLASGQSNMELQVEQAKDAKMEIAKANFPQIHFIIVGQDKKLIPQEDIREGTWKVCDTTSVKKLSAVAYYFACQIQRDQDVPIGIIQSTWGGTPVEAWTSRDMLLTSQITRPGVFGNDTLTPDSFVQDSLNLMRFWDCIFHPKNKADKIVPAPGYDDSSWPSVQMPRLIKDFGIGRYEGVVWMRKTIALPESFKGKDLTMNLGHPEMNYSLYFNGAEICKTVWNANLTHSYTIPAKLMKKGENTVSLRLAMLWGGGGLNPPADSIYITDGTLKIALAGTWLYQKDLEETMPKIYNYQYYPALLFNAMINPLIPYGIKGILWYQGEANDSVAYSYRKMFPMLISDWRQRWRMGDLPFLYVQLPNYKKVQPLPGESEWAELREAQAMALALPNTGMACVIDSGDAETIHPTNKQVVGHRLALLANKLVYGEDCVSWSPMYQSYRKDGSRIRVIFANTVSGLKTSDGKDVVGFAVAGQNKHFYWAKASIEGNEVVVYSDKVTDPIAVRYAWADNPVCNLVNSAGLPAIPFRTDDWKGITQK